MTKQISQLNARGDRMELGYQHNSARTQLHATLCMQHLTGVRPQHRSDAAYAYDIQFIHTRMISGGVLNKTSSYIS